MMVAIIGIISNTFDKIPFQNLKSLTSDLWRFSLLSVVL